LKKYFNQDLMPTWGLEDIIENISSPNRPARSIVYEEERVKMMSYTAPGRGPSTDLLNHYRLWLLKKIHEPISKQRMWKKYYRRYTTNAVSVSTRVANTWFNESSLFKLEYKLGIGEDNVANNSVLTDKSIRVDPDPIDDLFAELIYKGRKAAYYSIVSRLPPPLLRKFDYWDAIVVK
jgi:hypothetical protein